MLNLNKLSKENKELFLNIYKEIKEKSRFNECEKFPQHGDTSTKQHVVNVALLALNLSEKFNIKVNKKSLIIGALLHDYYLYDWHNEKNKLIHGQKHPKEALKQALKEFNLNDIEKDIIIKHMFPLTINFPKYKESVLVCIVDKICALAETIDKKFGLDKNKKFEPGTVIKRTNGLTNFYHYGIVVENNQVIHFINSKVIKTNMYKFAKRGFFLQECREFEEKSKYTKEEIIERAYSKLGTDFGGFNYIYNNCEHFCYWIVTGKSFSSQVYNICKNIDKIFKFKKIIETIQNILK